MDADVLPPPTRPRSLRDGSHLPPSPGPSSSPQSQLEIPRDLQERIAQPLCLCKESQQKFTPTPRPTHTHPPRDTKRFPNSASLETSGIPGLRNRRQRRPSARRGVRGIEGEARAECSYQQGQRMKGHRRPGEGSRRGRVPVSCARRVPRRRGERRQAGGASPHPLPSPQSAAPHKAGGASGPRRGHHSGKQQAPVTRSARPGVPLLSTLTMPL